MTRIGVPLARLARTAVRGRIARSVAFAGARGAALSRPHFCNDRPALRSSFSTSSRVAVHLTAEEIKTAQPAEITEGEYHELADEYIETLLTEYEKMQDDRTDIDVEYSVRRHLYRRHQLLGSLTQYIL